MCYRLLGHLVLTVFISVSFIAPVAGAAPNDRRFATQWALQNNSGADISYIRAMELVDGAPKAPVVVAVIDSAMDISHPDLRERLWRNPKETRDGVDNDGNGLVDDIHGWDFINNDNSVGTFIMPHATAVAGLIAAESNNNYSIAGVAGSFPVQIMPLQILNISDFLESSCLIEDGEADFQRAVELTQAALDALEYAIDNKADVINMSLGARLPRAVTDQQQEIVAGIEAELHSLLGRAENLGIPIIAAAGNSNNRYYTDAGGRLMMDVVAPKIRFSDVSDGNGSSSRQCEIVTENGEVVYELREGVAPAIPIGLTQEYSNIIGVASIDQQGKLAAWQVSEFLAGAPANENDHSGYGANILLAAPGVDVRSTRPFYELNWLLTLTGNDLGTSFAAPLVTGAVATVMSLSPEFSPDHDRPASGGAPEQVHKLRELLAGSVIRTDELQGSDSEDSMPLVTSGGYLDLFRLYQQMGY